MIKFDIEEKLQNILSKYHLENSEAEKRRQIYRIVENTLKNMNQSYSRIAIRCAGRHTFFLLTEFEEFLKVDYLIDQEPEKVSPKILEFNIPIYDTVVDSTDAIIIGTYDYRDEIKQELKDAGCENVIDLYDVLEQNGYFLQCEFYNYYNEPYKLLIELKQQYLNCEENGEKGFLLENLIREFLGIRDFLSAFNWIDEYNVQGFVNAGKMGSLKMDLQSFLEEIKVNVKKKTTDDIIWFWQDGLPQYIVGKMPFLSSMKEKGLYFNQSYSHNPVTRSVYGNILDKTMEVERYKGHFMTENHELTLFLKEKGYKVIKVRQTERTNIDLNKYDYNSSTQLAMLNVALTEVYWSALRTLLSDETPLVLLLHTGIETHIPVMAPTLDKYVFHGPEYIGERFEKSGRDKYIRTLEKTSKYVDEEICFFVDILGSDITKIYMSDHGDVLTKDSYFFTRDAIQTVLAVDSPKIIPKHFNKLFPLSNFLELFQYILNPSQRNEENLFVDEMRITGVDFYNLELVQQLIKMDYAKYGIAYDGFLTTDERYVLLATGEELYSTSDADLVNGIHEEKNKDNVQKWRNKLASVGYDFICNKDSSKFDNAKLLYESLGKARKWD